MSAKLLIELFGYLGSALVVVSMLMTSVMKLRIINTIGSVIFMIYALIIKSYPTALMNLCLVAINIFQMLKLRDTEKQYELLEVPPSDGFVAYLLNSYTEDIKKFFPHFNPSGKDNKAFLVFCDKIPAGVLLGTQNGESLDISLDYSTPTYRDCSVGTFLYDHLKGRGLRRLVCKAETPAHTDYLQRMGFSRDSDGTFVKVLSA